MKAASTLDTTIARVADALESGPLAADWEKFLPLSKAAAWCAMVEEVAPGTPHHNAAKVWLEGSQAQAEIIYSPSRARDQLILGWDWWRWYAKRHIDDDVTAVAA